MGTVDKKLCISKKIDASSLHRWKEIKIIDALLDESTFKDKIKL